MAQETNSPSEEQEEQQPVQAEQEPFDPDIKIQGELPMFFKVLAASLVAGVDRTEQRAQKATLAKQAREVARVNRKRAKAAGQQSKTRVPLLAAAAAILAVAGVMAAMPAGSDQLSDDIMGVWESSAEDYADRTFEIKPDQVVFQQGDNKYTTHPITRSVVTPDGESVLYVIKYDNNGTEFEFSFLHQPDDGLIRFKNQPQIKWYMR